MLVKLHLCTPWQCSCSSHWVSVCFSIYGTLLLALSRFKSLQLNQGGLALLPSPLKDMNGFCASRRVFLKTSQHLLSPLFSMEASHRIPSNQALSKLKYSLPKFKTLNIYPHCVQQDPKLQYCDQCSQGYQ